MPTTVAFHREIFEHPDFVAGRYDINFLEQRFRKGQEAPPAPEEAQEEAIAAGETVSRLTLLRGSEAGVLAEEETVETGAPDSASDNKQ